MLNIEIIVTKYLSISIMILLIGSLCIDSSRSQSLPNVSSGKIVRIESFKSNYIDPRNIDIWLPENYNETKKYPVLYMHDGQMLFDSSETWNKQEWMVSKAVTDDSVTDISSHGMTVTSLSDLVTWGFFKPKGKK